MNNYDGYSNLLVECLMRDYHLSDTEAREAYFSSAVKKMMDSEKTANWQMHQPLKSTVAEIYNEYEGAMIPS